MSNRLFQGIIHQMSDSIGCMCGVLDNTSQIVACSDLSRLNGGLDGIAFENIDLSERSVVGEYTFKLIGAKTRPEYAVFVEGTDDMARTFADMIAVTLSNLQQFYDEKYDRNNFIKNIVLDNILPGDIQIKARELHLSSDVSRVVFLIRVISSNDVSTLEILQNLFPDKNKDFVFNITESDIVLIKEVRENTEAAALEKLAYSISDTLSGEFYTKAVIGIGTVTDSIRGLAVSFKNAQVALEVSKVFDTEKTIISYENLGIARLIYHLPTTLCEAFLKEVFKKGSIESLDQETLFTIQKFFENNLNVSETSRKLFVHRNTLVYRLEKIKKLTGLDLREFDHAIVFKIALMVKKYLANNPTKF